MLKIIISPAKKMNVRNDILSYKNIPFFINEAQTLFSYMKNMSLEELKNLWKCSDKLVQENEQQLQTGNLKQNLSPAVLSYEGIQYKYMAPAVFEELLGLFFLGLGSLYFGMINLEINLNSITFPNICYGIGIFFALTPLVPLSCCTLNNSELTNASGLQNLLKNTGGAIGTSISTTMISRFAQIHQNSQRF